MAVIDLLNFYKLHLADIEFHVPNTNGYLQVPWNPCPGLSLGQLDPDLYIELLYHRPIQCDLVLDPLDCHIRALADPHTFESLTLVDNTTHLTSKGCDLSCPRLSRAWTIFPVCGTSSIRSIRPAQDRDPSHYIIGRIGQLDLRLRPNKQRGKFACISNGYNRIVNFANFLLLSHQCLNAKFSTLGSSQILSRRAF